MKDGWQKAKGRRQKGIAPSAGSSFILGLRPRPAALHRGVRSPAQTCAGTFFGFPAHPSSFALCLALLAPALAAAQILIDPTRPPVGYLATEADAGEDGGGLMLQSVMISPTQKTAIINGVVVKLGEKYGDAVLTRVAESEVVLRSGGVNRVLKLYPGVDKREAGQPTATAIPRGGKTRDAGTAAAGGASSR